MKTVIVPALLLFATAGSAQAGDAFVEGGVDLSYGLLAEVAYDDPVGSLFTVNARDGTRIIPQRLRRTPWSSAAALSLGYRFGGRFFARATYRHFGSQEVVADGLFFFNPANPSQVSATFPQRLSTTAHGFFLGTGIEFDLGEAWFADLSLEAGAAYLRAAGVRDVGTVIEQPFPPRTRVNPAYGAGLTLGRRLDPRLALLGTVNWNRLGRADSDAAPDIGGGPRFAPGVRPTASITGDLTVASLLLALRFTF